MFKNNFIKLCNLKGVSPSSVCRAVGLSNASFSCWTDDSIPRRATLMKIADYFGVTVDELLGDTLATTPKEKAPAKAKAADPYEEKLLEDFRACDIEGRMAVLGTAQTERVRTEKKAQSLA